MTFFTSVLVEIFVVGTIEDNFDLGIIDTVASSDTVLDQKISTEDQIGKKVYIWPSDF